MLRSAFFGSFFPGEILILIFGNLLGVGIPSSDLVRTLLGQPNGTVRRRHGRVNCSSSDIGNREILHLSRFRVEPSNFVRYTKVWDPQIPALVRSGAER